MNLNFSKKEFHNYKGQSAMITSKNVRVLFYVALLLLQSAAIAQRFYWAEDDERSNFFTSSIRAIEVDSENNVVAFGIIGDRYITETLDVLLDSSYNYFIAKFDPEGDVIWFEAIGSSGYLNTTDNQIGLALDGDDNIYIAAPIRVSRGLNFQGTIVEYGGAGSGSDTDVFLAKYGSDGSLDFVTNQSADDSYPNALTVDNSGNIYLAGTFSGDIDLDVTHTSNGGDDAYLAMYNQSGVPLWSHHRGNSINDDSFDLVNNGTNVYWGTNIKTGSAPAQFHSVIEKFDASGTSIWTYTISATDEGHSLNGSALHSDASNIYIAGDFRTSIEFPTSAANFVLSTTPSNYQSFVSKLTDGGSAVSFNWAVQRGSTASSDFSFDIKKAVGRVFLLKRDSWELQLERLSDSDGSYEDRLMPDHPAASSSYGYSLDISSDNSIYIGGYHTGSLGFGSLIRSSRGSLLIKTSETLSDVDWIESPLQHKKEITTSTHDSYGNMYVAGFLNGEYKDERDLHLGQGGNEGYFQKFSSTGELLFTRMHSSFLADEIIQIEVHEDYLYVAGTFDADDGSSNLRIDETNVISGEEDVEVYLTKYDLDGNLIWAINAASTEGDVTISDLAVDDGGNVYLHGDALGGSPKDFGNGISFGFDESGSFLAKYNPDGLTQWVNILEGTESDAVAVLSNQVIISGTFDESIDFEGVMLTVDGINDIYVASYTLDGAFEWVNEAGGEEWDYATRITTDAEDESIYISGYFYNDFSIDTDDLIGERTEGFIAKYHSDGTFRWVSGGGGSRNDYFYSLDLDTVGNPYVIGKYEGSAVFGELTFTGFGDRDIQAILIGYDANTGDEIFSSEYGHPTNYVEGDDDDYFNSISIDQKNDFYLTGDFIDEVALDTILLPDDGNNTFFITKMSLSDCAYIGDLDFEVSGDQCGFEPMSFVDLSNLGAHEIVGWAWDFGDGNASDEQNPMHAYANGGDYLVTLTVAYFGGACELNISKPISIISANQVSAGEDIEVCRSEEISLNGLMSGSTTDIIWSTSGDGIFADPTDPETTYAAGVNDLATGQVELVIASHGSVCAVARDTLVANIREEAIVNAGEDQLVCFRQIVEVAGAFTGASSVEWTTRGDGTFDNSSLASTNYTPGNIDLINGSVELVLSSNNSECEIARDTVNIEIAQELIANAGEDLSICSDGSATLSGSVFGSGSFIWTTSGDGTFDDSGVLNTTYTPGSQDILDGTVEIAISTIGNDCEEVIDALQLTILRVKQAEDYTLELISGRASQQILTTEEMAAGLTIQLASEPASGEATTEDGGISYTLTDPSVISDSFSYFIETACGIESGKIDIINVLGAVEVYNVVTPNGDGHHDFLKIKNIESYPENSVTIFDRAGKVVFAVEGYSSENVFEGKSENGKELPEGNYYYRLKIPTMELDQSGFILLKR